MTAANPYKQYQQQSILTMTPGELIVRLYDECLKRMNAALFHIDEGRPEEADACIRKTQQIVHYLDVSLDMQYEVSTNLHQLYDYFIRTLVQANVRKRKELLQSLIPMMQDLRDSFQQAEKQVHMK